MPRRVRILACVFVLSAATAARAAEPQRPAPELTFFGWSDQHISVKGDASHLLPAVDAMNELPGTDYPPAIGGKVAKPAFVIGCGDSTEWPTHAARNAYNEILTKRLRFPSYELLGNHDEGGKVPSDTMRNWIISRHGALSYTFEHGGVLFIMAYSRYDENLDNPAQPIHKQALEFIRDKLKDVPRQQPVVVALHLCFEAITNRDELLDALGDANVILILGGHYHKHTISTYRGRTFLQLPSPQSTTIFTVVRITPDRLVALPWDYKARRWTDKPDMVLDMPPRRPAPEKPRAAAGGAGR